MSKVYVVPQYVLRNPRALQDMPLEEASPIIQTLCAACEYRLAVSRASHSRRSAELLLQVAEHMLPLAHYIPPNAGAEALLIPIHQIVRRRHNISLPGIRSFADTFWMNEVRTQAAKGEYRKAHDLILRARYGPEPLEEHEGEPPRLESAGPLAASPEALKRLAMELCRVMERANLELDGTLEGSAWDYQERVPTGMRYLITYEALGLPFAHALGCIRSSGQLDLSGKYIIALARYFARTDP